MHDPRPLKLGFVRDAVKWQIYQQFNGDPERNPPSKLAEEYQMSVARVRAIILLKGREMEVRRRGEVPIGDGKTAEFETMFDERLQSLSKHYKLNIENDGGSGMFHQTELTTYKEFRLLNDDDDAQAIQKGAARALDAA